MKTVIQYGVAAVFVLLLTVITCPDLISQPKWVQLPSPTTRTLKKASFIDSLNGWVAGDTGTIMKTTTGGASWALQDSKITSDISDIFMLDSQRAWALSKVWTGTGSWFGTLMLSTTDAGITWANQKMDSIFLNTILFLDSLHGWIAGEGGVLLETSDGGGHWIRPAVTPSIAANMPIHRIKFFTPSIGYAVGGVSEMYGVVWSTLDSGQHWSTTKVAENLFDVAFQDSLNILCIGGGYDDGAGVAQTADAGLNWTYKYLGLYGRAITISFRTVAEGWSMLEGQTACMFSTDSGGTWNGITIKKGVSFYDAVFPDERHGFAVGTLGTVMTYNSASLITIADRWNIVSVPVKMADQRKTVLFPTALSDAYKFTSEGYEPVDILSDGFGYWMKFSGTQVVSILGYPILAESISVRCGWNMIGSISYPIPVSEVKTVGANLLSPFYAYERGYIAAAAIEPGKGYWVKVDSAGTLVLSIGSNSAQKAQEIR